MHAVRVTAPRSIAAGPGQVAKCNVPPGSVHGHHDPEAHPGKAIRPWRRHGDDNRRLTVAQAMVFALGELRTSHDRSPVQGGLRSRAAESWDMAIFKALLLASVSLLAALPLDVWSATGRWALVIGNDAYQRVEPLRNAVADSNLIGDELELANFSVARVSNATSRRAMVRAVVDLTQRAKDGGELVLYYAGHGLQVSDTNYLLPTDFDGDDTSLLAEDSLSLPDILATIEEAKPRFALIIIDACRNNPLPKKSGRNLAPRGLATPQAASGQMIVFAAGRGQVALDDAGIGRSEPNGLFAQELAREMRRPGLDIRDMMTTLRATVERRAAAVRHLQRPAIYDESNGNFAFYPATAPVADAGSAVQTVRPNVSPGASPGSRYRSNEEIEDELWRELSKSQSPEAYAAYLREYPSGRYASSARALQSMAEAKQMQAGGTAPRDWTATGDAGSRSRPGSVPGPGPVPAPVTGQDRAALGPGMSSPAFASIKPDQLVGKRFLGRNERYVLQFLFQRDGTRIERFTGPAAAGSGSAAVGGTSTAVPIRCGTFNNSFRPGEGVELKARCYVEDALRTAVNVWGTFPMLRIEQPGMPGADVIQLREVR